jgi:hypothetical protein
MSGIRCVPTVLTTKLAAILLWMMDNIYIRTDPAGKYQGRQREVNRKDRRCHRHGDGSGSSHPVRQ